MKLDWGKKLITRDGHTVTLVLHPDRSRNGCAYGYVGDKDADIHKWDRDGSHLEPFTARPYALQVMNKIKRTTLHLNVYWKNGEWEVAVHETIERANMHRGDTCIQQTAIVVEEPEEL